MKRSQRRFGLAAAACIATALGAPGSQPAFAHAYMDRTVPEAGSTVRGSPAEVKLWFSHALEPAFSTVRVVDGNGRQVERKDQRVDAKETTLLRVSLPPLPPGSYRVIWRVLSADGHVTRGDFRFEVAP